MTLIEDDRQRLGREARHHQREVQRALHDLRSGLPLLRYAAGAAFVGLLYFRLRGRRAPTLLLAGGVLFEVMQRWQRSQQRVTRPRPVPRLPPPPDTP